MPPVLRLALFGSSLLIAAPALAQSTWTNGDLNVNISGRSGTSPAISTTPLAAASTQTAGTITLGNTFQTALAASATRKGCTLQNTSTHTMSVYVGLLVNATALNALQVPAGGFFYCASGSVVVSDAINITTSTTTDPYVVASQ